MRRNRESESSEKRTWSLEKRSSQCSTKKSMEKKFLPGRLSGLLESTGSIPIQLRIRNRLRNEEKQYRKLEFIRLKILLRALSDLGLFGILTLLSSGGMGKEELSLP